MALNFPDSPTDGQVYNGFQWDATPGVWRPVAADPSLAGLSDTDIVSPVSGEVLAYDGSNWVNQNSRLSNNAIINGDFGVWQRGTSFGPSGTNQYSADRWFKAPSSSIMEVTRESFTPADIEAIGYGDAEYYLRMDVTVGNNFANIFQRIEDVRTFAGQTVTLSFWARSDSTRTYRAVMTQSFGSGGSPGVNFIEDVEIGTSWQRYTVTTTLGSMSGKTIGTGSFLQLQIDCGTYADVFTLDLWGVQLEAGSVATPFRLAGGGSKAAELALCQRYYTSFGGSQTFEAMSELGIAISTTRVYVEVSLPTQMRIRPLSVSYSNLELVIPATANYAVSSLVLAGIESGNNKVFVDVTTTGVTQYRSYILRAANNLNARLAFDAEL